MKVLFKMYALITLTFSPLKAQPQRSAHWTVEPSTTVKRAKNGVLQIEIWDYVTGWKAPIFEMSAAIKHFPRQPQFRVNWNRSNIGSGSYSGTVLYNRRKQIIKIFGVVSDWESKKTSRLFMVYNHVTDLHLHKLHALVDKTDGGGSDGNFTLLSDLGITTSTVYKRTIKE